MLSYIALAALFSRAHSTNCTVDSDCSQYGFECASGLCNPACSTDDDCNYIWGYNNATCMSGGCVPLLLATAANCLNDTDCATGFSCFDTSTNEFLTSQGLENFCYPGCTDQADCDAIAALDGLGYECVNVDYVAFDADICTEPPSKFPCTSDDDCDGDLKCLGSGPGSLCYMGCDSNDDCATGGTVDYECVTDDFGFEACRPAGLDIACTDTCVGVNADGLLDGYTCAGGACAPLCTEGDDSSCDALTGEGSTCLTMGDSTGQKLSVCYDAALSTATTPAPVTPAPTSETAACSADSDCPQYGFKCSAGGSCYPACSDDEDCNAIWGYGGATCEYNNASTATTEDDFNYCSPLNLAGLTSCSLQIDCLEGFTCSTLLGDPGFCYPPCASDDDCTGDLDGYSCVEVDYVAFSDNICTAPPTNYACDSDDDCEGDLKCFGSGPASLCYMGCDSDDDCETTATGAAVDYACVTDPFGFSACRPAGVNISCTDTCVDVNDAGLLDEFTCVGGACAPLCTEGDDSSCDALTGVGSTCVTMDDGTGQKLSVCYDAALSTISATPAPTTEDSSAAATHMVLVALSAAAAVALAQE